MEGSGRSPSALLSRGDLSSIGWFGFLYTALFLGACLRFAWPNEIEYKLDEDFAFEELGRVWAAEPFPWLGRTSELEIRPPGMGLWVLLALGKLVGARTPPELARCVQWLNVLALISLYWFATNVVEPERRRTWQWAGAFAAVNPFAVLLHRKIWAQSTLPVFCVLMLWAWYHKDRRWGAFLWGLVGICLGQIHISGFFMAAGVFAWTALAARRGPSGKSVAWIAWVVGTIVGSFPMIPWLDYLLALDGRSSWDDLFGIDRVSIINSRFWQLWVTGALGIGGWYHLGLNGFIAFLSYPLVGGTPTYLVAFAHVAMVGLGAWALVNSARALWGEGNLWKETVLGSGSQTALIQNAALLGFGIAISLSGMLIHRHSLIVTFPLEWVWLAGVVEKGVRRSRTVLGLLWLAQLVISVNLLWYLHVNHGAATGDFGVSYLFQFH